MPFISLVKLEQHISYQYPYFVKDQSATKSPVKSNISFPPKQVIRSLSDSVNRGQALARLVISIPCIAWRRPSSDVHLSLSLSLSLIQNHYS